MWSFSRQVNLASGGQADAARRELPNICLGQCLPDWHFDLLSRAGNERRGTMIVDAPSVDDLRDSVEEPKMAEFAPVNMYETDQLRIPPFATVQKVAIRDSYIETYTDAHLVQTGRVSSAV